ncbi:MAG: NAD(P)H-binding protein [Acidobacteriota bacterium]|nr:NAD(P)H-binding protein [Acidobacteriota bacterium]
MSEESPHTHRDPGAENASGEVLLTGATGFVGRHLYPALEAAGYPVRCATRRPDAAARRRPERRWVRLDVDHPETLVPALEGCRFAYFLIHEMGGDGRYEERERRAAEAFSAAAHEAGVERIVYLGGVAPAGEASRHLRSRLGTGEVLRSGPVPALELRAGMVMGAGSASWQMVRDLAARLPAMILPRWLRNHSQPVFIDDVVLALLASLSLPLAESRWLDLPGPEALTHRELLERVAARLGRRPLLLDVPVLTPKLSSYWIALVTRTRWALARELVQGLTSDLLPSGESVWDQLPAPCLQARPTELERAIELCLSDEEALKDEKNPESPSPAALRRLRALAHDWTQQRAAPGGAS